MMLVEPAHRGGLGYALKTLQAAVALAAGFELVSWTVDPLRAANARLNFERLGACCDEYVEDLYGSDFAAGLYGGMPSDRLLVRWEIAGARVSRRLLHGYQPLSPDALRGLPDYVPGIGAERTRLPIPSDIDTLLARDPRAALDWRYRLRFALENAFADGYAITGFAGTRKASVGYYLLERGRGSSDDE
jgi:predicted GNAT superfamily acetyltransferase